MPMGHSAHDTCGASARLAPRLSSAIVSMITKPWRIWRLGGMRPASRPLAQAPPMMPAMLITKNQKNSVGPRPSNSPRKAGADST